MFNLVAFYANAAQNAALVNLTPVTDPIVTIQNNRLIFPTEMQIGMVQGLILDGSRMRINTPSLRSVALPEQYPVKITAEQGTNPVLIGPQWDGLRIPRNDEFGIDISRAGSGAGDCFAGVWYAPRQPIAPRGPIITMRATSTTVLTVGTWVASNLTFDQSLPYGDYTIVGMTAIIADAVYARLAFPGIVQYRPGVPVVEDYGSYVNPPVFRWGTFGSFGTFNSTAQPLIEVLGHTAGSEPGVYLLDLIRVGS